MAVEHLNPCPGGMALGLHLRLWLSGLCWQEDAQKQSERRGRDLVFSTLGPCSCAALFCNCIEAASHTEILCRRLSLCMMGCMLKWTERGRTWMKTWSNPESCKENEQLGSRGLSLPSRTNPKSAGPCA